MQHHDTIAAIVTPPGVGAIGIIRLSGARAIDIADTFFKGKQLTKQASHTIHYGIIVDADTNDTVDEVVVSLFRNPHSYTGEDTAEISCHGSPYILQKALELCLAHGARPAMPGEFTQRAFLNGKLDLTQAEAVHDIIASESAAAHKAAMHQLRGGFSSDLRHIRDELITFAALIELELDFSEEDVEFADRAQLKELLQRVHKSTSQLIASFRLGNAAKNGVRVAIIGAPNAGKSTLLNALLNEERAIVSDIPGTTRDTVEEVLNIDGILFRFIDTAGIRETTDQIEARGIERAMEKVAGAEVVIHLYEEDHRLLDELADSLQDKVVFNLVSKTDIHQWPNDRYEQFLEEKYPHYQHFGISVKTGFHLDRLRQKLVESFSENVRSQSTIITNARHLAALQEIQREVEAIQSGLTQGLSGDLLSHHIRAALFQIGLLTGEVQHDRDILGTIFGKFCIGK